ncbi:MAG: hypothetical protein EBY39_02825 [Flavobacteriia bacterium]|nr:hypothetical protein [Flavobacteriia bacterium]
MEELQNTIDDLQARLAIVGGGRIIITSDHVSVRLGKEHEYFEVQEQSTFDSSNETDVEMYNQMWG